MFFFFFFFFFLLRKPKMSVFLEEERVPAAGTTVLPTLK